MTYRNFKWEDTGARRQSALKKGLRKAFNILAVGTVGVVAGVAAYLGPDVFLADENAARKVLQEAGYTDIKVDGFAWESNFDFTFIQKDNYDYFTAFEAKNPSGRTVDGYVASNRFLSLWKPKIRTP